MKLFIFFSSNILTAVYVTQATFKGSRIYILHIHVLAAHKTMISFDGF